MEPHLALVVSDPSHAGEVRRAAAALASSLGFDAADVGRVALVVTEAATNILKHAGKGELLLRKAPELGDRGGIELFALDRGPGMADVSRCLQDGYSTAGSSGTGLGAISRLSASLEIYSAPRLGTALWARILPRGASLSPDPGPLRVGAVRVAAPGEAACGDDWSFFQSGARAVLVVADGLGHGPEAARASAAAIGLLQRSDPRPVEELLVAMHGVLLPTRGAAVSAVEVDLVGAQVHFAGIGNVTGTLASPSGVHTMVTQNGTLGGRSHTVRAFSYPWGRAMSLILHTDGLTSRTSPEAYPGLLSRHPSLVAAVLFRDFRRGRDDVAVVVVQEREPA